VYDQVIKNLPLTADEIEILKTALERRQETCIGIAEEFTVEGILEKLDKFDI